MKNHVPSFWTYVTKHSVYWVIVWKKIDIYRTWTLLTEICDAHTMDMLNMLHSFSKSREIKSDKTIHRSITNSNTLLIYREKYSPKQHLFAIHIVLTCTCTHKKFSSIPFSLKNCAKKKRIAEKGWWRWNRLRLVFNDLKVLVNIYSERKKKLYFYPSKCKNCYYKIRKIKKKFKN